MVRRFWYWLFRNPVLCKSLKTAARIDYVIYVMMFAIKKILTTFDFSNGRQMCRKTWAIRIVLNLMKLCTENEDYFPI